MTEETQALVRQLLEWVDGQSVTYASVLMQDAAAALTALARDLETARQERDAVKAALGLMAGGVGRTLAEEIVHQRDAAVRAARAETWEEAALLAGQSATAIRHMRQAFVASPVMGELAVVRAEALEQFAKGLHERATAAREGQ